MKTDFFNMTVVRVIGYGLTLIPGLGAAGLFGWVSYDPTVGDWGTLAVEIKGGVMAVATALGINTGIYARWGVR